MSGQSSPTRKHGLIAIDGALALIALLLIVQMWLLSATLESYLAGHHEVALPAAIISGLLFFICGGLYLFVARLDSEARRQPGVTSSPTEPPA
jgi:predicted Co/Zn/Cd cation transporter (cation efflux family)